MSHSAAKKHCDPVNIHTEVFYCLSNACMLYTVILLHQLLLTSGQILEQASYF